MRIETQIDGVNKIIELPDGSTPEQIDEVLGHLSPQKGYFDRIGDIGMKRANELADNIVAFQNKEKDPITLASNFLLKAGAGTASDVLGETISTLIPERIKNFIGKGAMAASESLEGTKAKQFVKEKAAAIKKGYGEYKEQNPNTVSNLEGLGNLASIAPVGIAVRGAKDVAVNSIRGAEALAATYAKKFPSKASPFKDVPVAIAPTLQEAAWNASQKAYKAFDEIGGGFKPEGTNKILETLSKSKQKPIGGVVLTKEAKEINDAIDEFSPLSGRAITFEDYQKIDSSLGEKAAAAYIKGDFNGGRVLSNAQDDLREMVKGLADTDIAGGKQGLDVLLNDAIPLYSAQAKMADIEKIINRANLTDNPATAMRTGFRNLFNNKKRFKTYPKEVQKLIIKAANSGSVDDLLGVVGSRLNQIIGGSVGGAPGFAASTAIAMSGRGARNYLRNRKAQRVIEEIYKPVRPQVEKYK